MSQNRRTPIAVFITGGALLSTAFWLSPRPTELEASPAPQEKAGVKRFMRAKLEASQTVLEGLVTENFDQVITGAEKMNVMSKAAEWQVVKGPIYNQHSAEFQRASQRLIKQAKEKNLEGATLAYLQLTMNCVTCHKYVRGAKIVRNDRLPSDAQLVSSLRKIEDAELSR